MGNDRDLHRIPAAAYASLTAFAASLAFTFATDVDGTTAVLSVSASVNANCTISATGLAFGRYEALLANATAPLNAAGALSIACTRGSAPKITMDLGQYSNGGRRYMAPGASPGSDALYYELYQPPDSTPGTPCSFPGTTPWGMTSAQTFVPSPPSGRTARTYSVCGTIPAGQFAPVGSYADTVVATVNF